MSRSVDLWVGKDDDEQAPPRVRLRVFERECGKCHRCRRKIGAADKWILEHRIAIILGGRNAEDNLCLTCQWCLPKKNAEDQAAKSKLANIQKRDLGIKIRKGQPMPGSRDSGWKRPMRGPAERRT